MIEKVVCVCNFSWFYVNKFVKAHMQKKYVLKTRKGNLRACFGNFSILSKSCIHTLKERVAVKCKELCLS